MNDTNIMITRSFESGVCKKCGMQFNELYDVTLSKDVRTETYKMCASCAESVRNIVENRNQNNMVNTVNNQINNPNFSYCTACGNPIPNGNAFCGKCGKRIGDTVQSIQKPSIETVVSIEREKKFVGSAIIYEVMVDNNLVCTLRNGEKTSFKIDGSESHSLFIDSHNPSTLVTTNGYGMGTALNMRLCSQVIEIPQGRRSINYYLAIKSHMTYSEIIVREV